MFAFLLVLIQLVVFVCGYVRHYFSILYLSLSSILFAATVLFLPLSLLMTAFKPSNVMFLAHFLPGWLFMVVGKLFMIVWDAVSPFDLVLPDLLALYVSFVFRYTCKSRCTLACLVRLKQNNNGLLFTCCRSWPLVLVWYKWEVATS